MEDCGKLGTPRKPGVEMARVVGCHPVLIDDDSGGRDDDGSGRDVQEESHLGTDYFWTDQSGGGGHYRRTC